MWLVKMTFKYEVMIFLSVSWLSELRPGQPINVINKGIRITVYYCSFLEGSGFKLKRILKVKLLR